MSLPVRTADASTSTPLDDWRLAGERADSYLAALGFEAADRRRLTQEAIARAAAGSAWASGKSATGQTMIALHQLLARSLTECENEPLVATPELMAASARVRLHRWLAERRLEGAVPLEETPDGRERLAAMPPMERVNMSPARITRRPAPLRWLFHMLGA
ncbi:MAG TPA: hypothetical protein VFM97_02730 [Gammaproteobacteria bacterium]|nr:hypothetical protein [Gammaproteobacteria bacterium]